MKFHRLTRPLFPSSLPFMARSSASFYLNGTRFDVSGEQAFQTLAEYLRITRGLTGTKIVCAEGDCGACTVLKSVDGKTFEAMNSCIALTAQMDGSHLVTIEGLKKGDELAPAQQAMMKCHGSQCGYCTPGFVMAMTWMLEKRKPVDEQTAKNHLTGNLCRCTGYEPIIEAAVEAGAHPLAKNETYAVRYLTRDRVSELDKIGKKSVEIDVDSTTRGKLTFFAPKTLSELLLYRKKHPTSVIIGAATDLGVLYNKGKAAPTHLVSLHLITELYKISAKKTSLYFGSRVTLSNVRRTLEKTAPELGKILDLFASPQIKNTATLIGNIATASPIGDTAPFLLALGAVLEVATPGKNTKRKTALSDFYLGYRKTTLKRGEVITGITFNLPKKDETFRFYKTSQRKDLDISCVNTAIWMKMDGKRKILDSRIALGGVAATPLRLKKTERILKGRIAEGLLWDEAVKSLQYEITPMSDLRGTAAYRRVLAENIFRSLVHEIAPA